MPVPRLHDALDAVRQQVVGDRPVRGLLWLACLSGGGRVAEPEDPRVIGFVNDLIVADKAGERFSLHLTDALDELMEGLPRRVAVACPDIIINGFRCGAAPPNEFRLKEQRSDARLHCVGVGVGSSFDTPLQPLAWTVLGLALDNGLVRPWPVNDSITRTLMPLTSIVDMIAEAPPPLELTVDWSRPTGALTRPMGAWVPAFRDDMGRVHDVADLVVARMDVQTATILASATLHAADSDPAARAAVARQWGVQVARTFDIAMIDLPGCFKFNQSSTPQGDRLCASARSLNWRPADIMAQLICAGAEITPAMWGIERCFGNAAIDEMRSLALPILTTGCLSDSEKSTALEALHALGHDVVIAHRPTGAEAAAPVPLLQKVFTELPLMRAVESGLPTCVATLMDLGADPHAKCLSDDAARTPMGLAYAMGKAPDEGVHAIMLAAEARVAAQQAIRGLDREPAAGAKP